MTAPATITNPTGRCFVSYRRSRLDEIRRLVAALHDHGVPTWQDLTNLDEEPLEPALRAALADPGTASGILWITPEVADSPVITGIEIPAMTVRAERGDAFYLVPVAAGGLDYAAAARTALTRTTLNDFGAWNIARVGHDPINNTDADAVARRALTRRAAAIHAALPAGAPFVIDMYTRGPATHRPDAAVTVDFTHRFDGRHAHAGAWQDHILTALDTVVEETARRAAGRPLQIRGLVGLPAAVALGTTLLGPRAVAAAWMQHTPGRTETAYSLAEQRRPSGFHVAIRDHRPDAADLAVLINVSENTVPAVRATFGLPAVPRLGAGRPARHSPASLPGGLARPSTSPMRSSRPSGRPAAAMATSATCTCSWPDPPASRSSSASFSTRSVPSAPTSTSTTMASAATTPPSPSNPPADRPVPSPVLRHRRDGPHGRADGYEPLRAVAATSTGDPAAGRRGSSPVAAWRGGGNVGGAV